MHSYEEWTRSEISRLLAEAQRASAEADTLQRAFDKWLELQGGANDSPIQKRFDAAHDDAPAPIPARRGRRSGYGHKNAEALKRIKAASPEGMTTDEIFDAFTKLFGPKYKRSSLRAMLWNQRKLGTIENRNGRHVIATGQHT